PARLRERSSRHLVEVRAHTLREPGRLDQLVGAVHRLHSARTDGRDQCGATRLEECFRRGSDPRAKHLESVLASLVVYQVGGILCEDRFEHAAIDWHDMNYTAEDIRARLFTDRNR